MATHSTSAFRVLDTFSAPHGGIILRLRLTEGETPTLKALKSAKMTATGPDGSSCEMKVTGFALFGGQASDARFARTGRIDVRASVTGDVMPGLRWQVRLA